MLVSSLQYEVIKLISGETTELAADVYKYLGGNGLLQGNYENAIDHYKKALNIYNSLYANGNSEILKGIVTCCNDLAEIMIHTTEYVKAYSFLSQAINHLRTHSEENNELLLDAGLLYIRLGKLNIRFSKYEESKKNYQDAIASCERALLLSPENPITFATIALAYEKLGELYGSRQYEAQGKCYLQAIKYYDRALENKDEINYLRILSNKGLAYKRLAEHYDQETELAEKIKCFEKAVMIYNEVLEQSPDFIDTLEKKGHALVDYMVLQIELGQYKKAMESFTDAVNAFEKALEISPKQGGAKNRIGSAHRELALMYMKQNKENEAFFHLQTSLKIYDDLRKQSNYIYVHNSMGKHVKC